MKAEQAGACFHLVVKEGFSERRPGRRGLSVRGQNVLGMEMQRHRLEVAGSLSRRKARG